ncbi:DNA-processing protein DprA [Nocardia pseudobrasiliensis]|uniref:DNA processing protein n=1 Tax=Nocardia pseudobrasiliensis TaxID=45979 RepID=A0A370I4R3_9NOCA|nr:DNA-processing protein DprA [Nocardia pseudobrasiliensis]RDI65727.1 DNA processing protein [Nocardia pseudobrasiliensis]
MTHSYAAHQGEGGEVEGSLLGNDKERAALVAMMRLESKRVDWSKLTERLSERGSAVLLWEDEHPKDLFGDGGDAAVLQQAERDIQTWKRAPFQFHTFTDRSYPSQLRSVRQVPPMVFTHGKLKPGEIGICVVGSRNATDAGLTFARTICRYLVDSGLTVIAGLAKGIDTAAHRAALDADGRTVAVLGNGLNRVYPQENRDLQNEISERGMLLTHFLPEYPPSRWSFPARNVTMSAYGTATVIVEASEKSGTRIQAREAVAHGRPVIINAAVVGSTTWGRALQNEPGVYVAESAQQAFEHVQKILHHREMVSQLLGSAR